MVALVVPRVIAGECSSKCHSEPAIAKDEAHKRGDQHQRSEFFKPDAPARNAPDPRCHGRERLGALTWASLSRVHGSHL